MRAYMSSRVLIMGVPVRTQRRSVVRAQQERESLVRRLRILWPYGSGDQHTLSPGHFFRSSYLIKNHSLPLDPK